MHACYCDVAHQRYLGSVGRVEGAAPLCTFELPLGSMKVDEVNLAPYPMPAEGCASREHMVPYTLRSDSGGKTVIVRAIFIIHTRPLVFFFLFFLPFKDPWLRGRSFLSSIHFPCYFHC